jgi:hypothetical protein
MNESPKGHPPPAASAHPPAPPSAERPEGEPAARPSALAGLPRARPQRASARRDAARAARARRPRRDADARAVDESVPRQGYEVPADELRGSLEPPGGADLLASVGELASDLAKAGIGAGTRLVKDLLSRLPG